MHAAIQSNPLDPPPDFQSAVRYGRGMGKHWLIVLVCAAGLAIPRGADAQVSVWLQKGVSGVGAEAGVAVDDSSMTFHVAGGYSHLGVLDFDLGFDYTSFNSDNAIASDLGALGATAAVQYHPLKQGPDMPISLGLGLGLPIATLTSSELDADGISGTLWGINAGVAAYRFVKLAPNIGITPSIGLVYSYSHLSLTNMFGDEITSSDNNVGVSFTGNLGLLGATGTIYGISPSLFVGENVSFSVNLSMIWSVN